MSDTKALYDVVAKALANWGNGEAQDAFEALMGRLERAEADNTALLKALDAIGHALGMGAPDVAMRVLLENAHKPHPGAALLVELEGLHEENARLSEERAHWEKRAGLTVAEVVREVAREPIAIRVEGIPEPLRAIIERDAHNAALEEAAKQFAYALPVPVSSDTVQVRILALKKTGQGE